MIGANGEQVGIVAIDEALNSAKNEGLDLVNMSPNAKPPVCKIMNYGKFKYEQEKKMKEQKKNNKNNEAKSLSLSSTIGDHDLQTKANQCIKFFKDYDKVKISILLKGRQQMRPELAYAVMDRFFELVKDYSVIEVKPKHEGRFVNMFLAKIK